MKNYGYVVMVNNQEFDYGEYVGGSIEPVAVFSSKEEAEAVATLRQKSAERRWEDEWSRPCYYVVRVPLYS